MGAVRFTAACLIAGLAAGSVGAASPDAEIPPAASSAKAGLAFSDTLFASFDNDAGSVFVASGAKRAFGAPGAKIRAFLSVAGGLSLSDLKRFRKGKLRYDAVDRQSRIMAGIDHSAGMTFVSLGLGLSHALAKWTTRPARWRSGIALSADVWFRPDTRQFLTLSAMGDTASASLWARLRYGYRPNGWRLSFGPEIAASLGRASSKAKIGLHVSDLKVWRLEAAMSGGLMWDERRRPGLYGGATLWMSY